MTETIKNNDALANAFIHSGEQTAIVKSEDIINEGGADWKEIFFEPQVGQAVTLKLLTNPFGIPGNLQNNPMVSHRKVYKNLPDPKRKGKSFHYVSSGNAKTCKALELFFELNNLKKNGDVVAEQKIKEFMGATNQGAVLVQILSSPVAEDMGKIRIMTFSTYGVNATIANLIDGKLNPTEAQIKAGFEKEDVFSIFGSNVLVVDCTEGVYEGVKGRDFSNTVFSKNEKGAYAEFINSEGKAVKHEFSKKDLVDGKFTPDANEAFNAFIEKLKNPNLSIHNYFSYKEIGNPLSTKETEDYLVELNKKVDEIIPVIRNAKNIAEIKQYGIAEATNSDSAKTIGGQSAADILKTSAPSELTASILNGEQSPITEKPKTTEPVVSINSTVNDILNS